MTNLWDQILNHEGRPMQKWATYAHSYERFFSPWVNRPVTMLEIGVADGGSLELWRSYFGPYARIIGLDIVDHTEFTNEQVGIYVGSQDDTELLQRIVDEQGPIDIVLDDGSHHMDHVSVTFDYLYPRISPSGVYAVEDMHTAYWAHMGGGVNNPASFVNKAKSLVDRLNGDHYGEADWFTRSTIGISFADSMVVFEKGRRGPNYNISHGYS